MKTIEKLRNYMNETGIDAVLVHSEINQRYFAKFKFSDGVLVILPKNAYLVTDFRYYEEAEKNASKDFSVVMPQKRSMFINEIFSSHGVKTVGFEKDISYGEYLSLTNLYPDVTLVSLGDEIEKLRSVKSADELEKIASAQRIADASFAHLLSVITPNMTEIDVALELEFYMRSHGAEGISFETIAVSGDASALPHGKCRNEKLKKGFLTLDFGAVYDGYCSDMTRTLSVGRATDKMKDMYYTTLTAQLAALDAIRAGADCAYLDSIARSIIDGAGYEGCFGHSLGHGVGMFIHESPALSMRYAGELLVPGNVVTVEPGIYIQGEMGVRIEDTVAVEENGCRNFASSTKELIELFT